LQAGVRRLASPALCAVFADDAGVFQVMATSVILLCLLAVPYALLLAIALHGMRRKPKKDETEVIAKIKRQGFRVVR